MNRWFRFSTFSHIINMFNIFSYYRCGWRLLCMCFPTGFIMCGQTEKRIDLFYKWVLFEFDFFIRIGFLLFQLWIPGWVVEHSAELSLFHYYWIIIFSVSSVFILWIVFINRSMTANEKRKKSGFEFKTPTSEYIWNIHFVSLFFPYP